MMGKLEPAVSFAACSVMQCPFVPSPPCQVNDGALRDSQGTFSRVRKHMTVVPLMSL